MQPKYVFTNAWYFARELLFPCRSSMILFKFGSLALQKLAVLDFIGTPYACCLVWWRSRAEWGETAVVHTEGLAAFRRHNVKMINFVLPVHDAQFNLSYQRFKHWEVNKFDTQFLFLHASRVVEFRRVCGKGRQWIITWRTAGRKWVPELVDSRGMAWRT